MRAIVLDTDVSSLLIKHQLPKALHSRVAETLTCVTFVTIGELVRWMRLHGLGSHRRQGVDNWLTEVTRLPDDEEVAQTWGELSAAATERGRSRPPNDTWIAACCLVEGLPLATRNVKDFADFAQYHGLHLITD
jgi:toxin FitB